MRSLFILAAVHLAFASAVFGQGNLLPPPGPPTPTMKSLDQLEARIIVNPTNTPGDAANTFIISAPGSYYLTGNITGDPGKHGISIQADDVTLDLNGFALISAGGGGAFRGVDAPAAQTSLSLRNGTIRGWTDGGVRTDLVNNMLAEKLRLVNNPGGAGLSFGNGSARECVASGNGNGFVLGNGAQIKDCTATGNTTGFLASDRSHVSNCVATINAGIGFDCASYVTVMDCTASRNGGNGIVVLGSSSVIRCNASRNISLNGSIGGTGITAGPGSTIADCTAGYNRFSGISTSESSVAGSTAHSNERDGIQAPDSSVTYCSAAHNGEEGIEALNGSVAHCRSSNNGYYGIDASPGGTITNSTSYSNARTGILVTQGSISNCVSSLNGDHGIYGFQSVISFCRASGNNKNNNGSVQIFATGATLVSNNTDPAP